MQKLQWTRNGKNSRQSQHGNWRKSRAGGRLFWKHNETKIKSTSNIDGHMSPQKNAELEPKFQKYKGRVVLRGDIVRDDSGACAVFTEQGSSASQMTAVKVMGVIARLPDCDGQAADAVSAYTQVKLEDDPRVLKNLSQNVQTYGYVFHDTNCRNPGQTLQIQWYLSNEIYMDIHRQDCCGKDSSKKFYWNLAGKKSRIGNVFCSSKTRIILIGVCGWHEVVERSRIWLPCGRNWCRMLILTNQLHFSTTFSWDVLNVNANRIWATEKLPGWEKPLAQTTAWSCDMEGHARKCVEWCCELANKKVKQLYKVSSLCLDDHQLEGRTWISWRITKRMLTKCLKCLYLAPDGRTTWHLVVSQQACEISHKMDSSMWQTLGKADFKHSSHKWPPTIWSCGLHGSALQTGFVSRLGDLEDSKSTSGGVLCIFGSRTFVALDVQEKKRQCPTVLQGLKSFLWMLGCAWMEYLRSTSGTSYLRCYVQRTTLRDKVDWPKETIPLTKPRPKHQPKRESERSSNCQM